MQTLDHIYIYIHIHTHINKSRVSCSLESEVKSTSVELVVWFGGLEVWGVVSYLPYKTQEFKSPNQQPKPPYLMKGFSPPDDHRSSQDLGRLGSMY